MRSNLNTRTPAHLSFHPGLVRSLTASTGGEEEVARTRAAGC